ncbi:MBOAT family O-acyltransferase [Spongiivirga citrea]|uniref:MBOAT family protein n=1 Tax=Spongiivirga citrea TaxID=1481457 RepID=A0A6M0CGV4_9FLAO|nr:MBOAT family protein [Spongiivirga citrea]NER16163.1 MBOAT family protein [Spongiivirga citrea]
MLFNSLDFIFFFPIAVVVYYLFPHKHRWAWLLGCSYYFYMQWDVTLVFLLIASTLIDYALGIKMHRTAHKQRRKWYLMLSVLANVGMLFFFKYLGFFSESVSQIMAYFGQVDTNTVTASTSAYGNILLPVGISFYTFQTLSYSIDIYRGKIEPEHHLGKYALYVAFFPQLVAGPIERASRLLPQFHKKIEIDIEAIRKGIILMSWGFFLKMVVADRLGVYVDYAHGNPAGTPGIPLFLAMYFFGFQIYYDFSAYSIIAVGAAKVLGFDLMNNFNRPFFSTSAAQFWQRWHRSLMHWLRDYLYRPLVRDFKLKAFLAVFVVFFINGLWHGANWTFVVWGVLCGLFLLFEQGTNKLRNRILDKSPIPISKHIRQFLWGFVTLHYLAFTMIFFRSSSIYNALVYIKSMFDIRAFYFNITNDIVEIIISILLILLVQAIHFYKGNDKIYELFSSKKIAIRWSLYVVCIAAMVLLAFNRQNSFIYFQF